MITSGQSTNLFLSDVILHAKFHFVCYDKIPRSLHEFSMFLVNFQVFLLFLKWLTRFIDAKYVNKFHLNEKLTLSTTLQIKTPSFLVYLSNLEGSALFLP